MSASHPTPPATRRANTLVLVTALLVLLVIVATAYLGRTRGERTLAVAQQQAQLREDRADSIAEMLAGEIAEQLFVRPIPNKGTAQGQNPPLSIVNNGVNTPAVNSNLVRNPIPSIAVRHGADFEPGSTTNGYDYNRPMYQTVPWTNWPDFALYPLGPANPNGVPGMHDGNPAGNPGYGDNRLLRDLEPVRFIASPGPDGVENTDDDILTYTHWRHLTNIARPENGFRLCYNAQDAVNSVITDLSWPLEQWLPQREMIPTKPPGGVFGTAAGQISPRFTQPYSNYPIPPSGTYLYVDYAPPAAGGGAVGRNFDFEQTWAAWLGDHPTNYNQPFYIPPNFYLLSDLNGNGILNELGERPENAFDGPGTPGFLYGTGRWDVERVLTDTDGDGYTDAFWFLAPNVSERGLRQLVAVSIVDNGGLLNVNTATRFVRSNDGANESRKTIGATPADIALVGQNVETKPPLIGPNSENWTNWNSGFLDTRLNHVFDGLGGALDEFGGPFNFYDYDGDYPFRMQFAPGMFADWTTGAPPRNRSFLGELGVLDNADLDTGGAEGPLASQAQRSRYFQSMGTRLQDPGRNLRPFTMADELELHMYRGRNNASILSRLERAIDRRVGDRYPDAGDSATGQAGQQVFLRSDDFREETNGYFNVLSPPALLKDNRSKLTTYNAVRNDIMPPWAWPSSHPDATCFRYDIWTDGTWDFAPFNPATSTMPAPYKYDTWTDYWRDSIRKVDLRAAPGSMTYNEYLSLTNFRIRDALERAWSVVVRDPQGNPAAQQVIGQSYLGDFSGGGFGNLDGFRRLRKLCESFANNIIAAADSDDLPITTDRLATDDSDPYPYIEATDNSANASGPQGRGRRYPGFERHPFLLEAFVAHVYPTFTIPGSSTGLGYLNSGDRTVFADQEDGTPTPTTSIFVMTIANPFDRPLPLRNEPGTPEFRISVFEGVKILLKNLKGENVEENNVQIESMPPCLPPPPPSLWAGLTEQEKKAYLPATITLYAIADDFGDFVGDWDKRWLDYLDIPYLGSTNPNVLPSAWAVNLKDILTPGDFSKLVNRAIYDGIGENKNPITIERQELQKDINGAVVAKPWIVVDRIDIEDAVPAIAYEFRDQVAIMKEQAPLPRPSGIPPPQNPPVANYPINPGWDIEAAANDGDPNTVAVGEGDHWVQWRRVARSFGHGRAVDQAAPRFVSARRKVSWPGPVLSGPPIGGGPASDGFFSDENPGHVFRPSALPGEWFTHLTSSYEPYDTEGVIKTVIRKPTTFNLRFGETTFYDRDEDDNPDGFDIDDWYPDTATGVYWNSSTFQMLQRNRDFDRIGELSQVWLWGPELDVTNKLIPVTKATFAEVLSGDHLQYPAWMVAQSSAFINRLWLGPNAGNFVGPGGQGDNVLNIGLADGGATPALDAAARLYDVFVCDEAGLFPDLDGNGTVTPQEADAARYRLANGFTGRPVHGLININTATPEVMRALPHGYRLAFERYPNEIDEPIFNPRVRLAEAIVEYRDKAGRPEGWPNTTAPAYGDRGETGGFEPKIRSERGIAAIGEIEYMTLQPTSGALNNVPVAFGKTTAESWSSGFAAAAPFVEEWGSEGNDERSTRVSTDTLDRQPILGGPVVPDYIVGDVEEQRLLFTGISNLVTTRSDTFTVYFKIRTFRQDPVTGAWDATKRDNIVDESRYMMVVDRSEVNRPADKPKILMLEKLTD